jgi:hypothetical protein
LTDAGGRSIDIGSSGAPTVLALVGAQPMDLSSSSLILERVREIPARLPDTRVELIASPLTPGARTPVEGVFQAVAPAAAIGELAVALGVVVARERSGWIAGHAVVVADAEGRIVSVFRGVSGWSAAELARAVAKAAAR